jgi:S-adenosylmethionine-diacylglycerol 3-amino-3-carboxypropyl transferase
LLALENLSGQQALCFDEAHQAFWKRWVAWLAGQNGTRYLLGVPQPQIEQIKRHYRCVSVFIKERLDAVFGYFAAIGQLFLAGLSYRMLYAQLLPGIPQVRKFSRLKAGLMDRIATHTCTVTEFLIRNPEPISRLVLLDHMDWLITFGHRLLQEERLAIVDHVTPTSRNIWFETDNVHLFAGHLLFSATCSTPDRLSKLRPRFPICQGCTCRITGSLETDSGNG